MSENKYDLVWVFNEMGKEFYNFGVFTLNIFFKVTNLEALKESYNAYEISKFSQTIEDFQHEHKKLSKEQLKSFYENLDYNSQNLAYLYSLFDNSRKSTYRLHMKILAYLSAELIKKNDLSFYESRLLINIPVLNEDDFITFYNVLKNRKNEQFKNGVYMYRTNKLNEIISLQKLSEVGMIYQKHSDFIFDDRQKRFQYLLTDYSLKLYDILDIFFKENK